MRDAVFRGEEYFRLDAQPDREHFHVPDSVLGAVHGLGDPQDADPTADPGNVAEQLVAGLDLLAGVERRSRKPETFAPAFWNSSSVFTVNRSSQ